MLKADFILQRIGSFFMAIILWTLFFALIFNLVSADDGDAATSPIWHSYVANTGVWNREELHLSHAGISRSFTPSQPVKRWSFINSNGKTHILGLSNDSLLLYEHSEGDGFSQTDSADVGQSPVDIALFQHWNSTTRTMEPFAVVAILSPNQGSFLYWYKIADMKLELQSAVLWQQQVTHVEVFAAGSELSLMVISQTKSLRSPTVDMFHFAMDGAQDLWRFDSFALRAAPASAVITNSGDLFLSLSLPFLGAVHVYRHASERFELHQEIAAVGVGSLAGFSIGFQSYMAVTGSQPAVYRFHGSAPLVASEVEDVGVVKHWLAVPANTYREDTVLLAQGLGNITFVVNDGRHFRRAQGFAQMACADPQDGGCVSMLAGLALAGSAAFPSRSQRTSILIPSRGNSSMLFEMASELRPKLSDINLEMQMILAKKSTLEEKIQEQKVELENMEKSAPAVTSHEVLTNWKVGEIVALSGSHESNASHVADDIEFAGNTNWKLEDSDVSLEALRAMAAQVGEAIDGVSRNLKRRLTQSSDPVWSLPTDILGSLDVSGSFRVNALQVDSINGFNVDHILRTSFRKSKPQKIEGRKTFEQLQVESVECDWLGDLPASDIVFSDEPDGGFINGDVVYEHDLIVTDSVVLEPGGRLNGLDVRKDIFRPRIGYSGNLSFEELAVVEDTSVKTINDFPVILPLRTPPAGPEALNAVPNAIVDHVNVARELTVQFVNGRNFTQIMDRLAAMKKHNIADSSSVQIDNVLSVPDLEIDYLNGLKFPDDFVLSSSEDSIVISGEKNLTGKLTVERLNMDLSTLLPALLHPLRQKSEEKSTVVYENIEVDGNVLAEAFNEWDWTLIDDIVTKNEASPEIRAAKKFPNGFSGRGVTVGRVNGEIPAAWLTYDTEQTIEAPFSFGALTLDSAGVTGLWDELCVTCINETVVRVSGNGSFSSTLVFDDSLEPCLHARTLQAETVGDDVVLDRSHQLVGNITFDSLHVRELYVNGSLTTFNKVNDIDLNAFDRERLSATRHQVIPKALVHDNLTIDGNVQFQEVNERLVSLSTDHNITELLLSGHIHAFDRIEVRGSVRTLSGVNNVRVDEVRNKAVSLRHPGVVEGELVFEDLVSFDTLSVPGGIDDVHLESLYRDLVFSENGSVYLAGRKNFVKGVRVNKNLMLRSLNGHFFHTVLKSAGNYLMKGPVVVSGNLVITNDLNLYGPLNGHDLSKVNEKYSSLYHSYLVPGDVRLTRPVEMNTLEFGGTANGVDFAAFLGNMIRKNTEFNVTGRVELTNEVVVKDSVNVGLINGLDFAKFYEDIVLVNRPASIKGWLVVGKASLKTLEVTGDLNATWIDGYDVAELLEESIPLDGNVFIKGNKTFEDVRCSGPVKVEFLNGKPVEAMVSLKEDQQLPTAAYFSHLTATSDIAVGGFVNHVILTAERDDTVTVNGYQRISGMKTFSNLSVHGAMQVKAIDGKAVEELVTLHTNQTIDSAVSFLGPVVVDKDVTSLETVNGIDFEDWKNRSVSLDGAQEVTGVWTVLGDVIISGNVSGDTLLDDVSVRNISDSLKRKHAAALEIREEMRVDYRATCERVSEMAGNASKQIHKFQQFELLQELQFPTTVESVLTFKANGHRYLIATFKAGCMSYLYRWEDETYSYLSTLHLGRVARWAVIESPNTTYIVTSSDNGPGGNCSVDETAGNVWTFYSDEEKYGHLLGTKGFVDVVADRDTRTFYTLGFNGSVVEMAMTPDAKVNVRILDEFEEANLRFLPLELGMGLAVTDGNVVRRVAAGGQKIWTTRIPGRHNGSVSMSEVDGRLLTAVSHATHSVAVYRDVLRDKPFFTWPASNPGRPVWLSFGQGEETFLLFPVDGKTIEVFQYRGASGLKRKTTLRVASAKIQTVLSSDSVADLIIIIQEKTVKIISTIMLGSHYVHNNRAC